MERRFVAFLALAFAILMANSVINTIINPPPPRGDAPLVRNEPAADNGQPGAEPAAGQADGQPEPAPGGEPVVARPAQPAVGADPNAEQAEAPLVAVAQPALPQQWGTLGSVDPATGFRMLVTWNTRGAAIERLELASPRFRDLEDRSGYLGHLALDSTAGGGCTVRVVGPGTPADKSGLAPGDVITAVENVPVDSPEEFHRELQKTKRGQEITLSVTRAGGGAAVPLSVTLTRRPLEVMRPERENIFARRMDPPANLSDPASLLFTLDQIDDDKLSDDATERDELAGLSELAGVDLLTENWEVRKSSADEVEFVRALPSRGLEVVKRFTLKKVPPEQADNEAFPGYHLDVEIIVRNLGNAPKRVAYRFFGPAGLPTEGWWYGHKIGRSWGAVGLRDLAVQFAGATPQLFGCPDIADGDVEPMGGLGASLMYAGIDAQYFAAILLPQKEALEDVWFSDVRAIRIGPKPDAKTNKINPRLVNVTCRLTSKPTNLEPGRELIHRFQFFAGPKRPALLEQYVQGNGAGQKYSLAPLVYYGWFSWVAVWMLWLLHTFYGVVGNYGIAIIMLTVMVRGMLFPLSRKSAQSMARMQELQPEMKRLTEKYKDREKRARAQQELFRKHNVSPLGGCLPMFVQLPIFMGLYRSLMVDVELRQAPLLGDGIRWCSNLSAPDMLFDWSGFMFDFINRGDGIFGLGPYLNILPLFAVGMMIWQQKMFMPPPADEQAEMQQKIMKFMMIFMGILFFKFAAGLSLYFIVSTLWGIVERKMLPKSPRAIADASTTKSKPPSIKASTNGNTSGGKKKGKQRHKQKQKQKKK